MAFFSGPSCTNANADPAAIQRIADAPEPVVVDGAEDVGDDGLASAVLAGGCFWCTEHVFEPIDGVTEVVSGYAGGEPGDANYRLVSGGVTDHAEVIRVVYDPAKVTYGQLLKVFFTVAHDPTQLNRQGPDRGRQYRSAVFYLNDAQKQTTENYIAELEKAGLYNDPIVTTLEPLTVFHEAEGYHQDYVKANPGNGYVMVNALPKVEKLREKYPDKVAEDTD